MTEAQLQSAVIELAHILGWKVAHFRPALTARGWRTPVQADGAGFPDLVMVRGLRADGRLLFVELKSDTGRISSEQDAWMTALLAATFDTVHVNLYVWRPKQWLDGTIERLLREPLGKAA